MQIITQEKIHSEYVGLRKNNKHEMINDGLPDKETHTINCCRYDNQIPQVMLAFVKRNIIN
jgi:hypothetical protein